MEYTYCSSLWNHQMIDTAGKTKPCCRFVEEHNTNNNINTTSIIEIFKSDFMTSLRSKSLSGEKINGCIRCYEEQDNSKKSLRERINDNPATNKVNLSNPTINYLELAISNDCNLMCRICSSKYSQKLYQDEIEFFGKSQITSRYSKSNISAAYDLISELKYIKFTGGEPLIIKDHWELLKHAVSLGLSNNITINYSTNGTIFPKNEFIDLWKKFKKIELTLSIDSIIKEENEYQRHLTDHDQVLCNINQYINLAKDDINLILSARPTISIYNIFHLPETIEWLHDNNIKSNPTHLTYPEWLSVTVLPLKYKKIIEDKFLKYPYKRKIDQELSHYLISYMNSRDDVRYLNKFTEYTNFLDKKRKQDFKKTYRYYQNLIY